MIYPFVLFVLFRVHYLLDTMDDCIRRHWKRLFSQRRLSTTRTNQLKLYVISFTLVTQILVVVVEFFHSKVLLSSTRMFLFSLTCLLWLQFFIGPCMLDVNNPQVWAYVCGRLSNIIFVIASGHVNVFFFFFFFYLSKKILNFIFYVFN